jgi:xenotropic and polytropic retrovirus receptor 1
MLLLTLLFCAACRFWQYSKVNYVFVFEFDTRDHLDWRQLLEVSVRVSHYAADTRKLT